MRFAHLADCHIGAWRDPRLRSLVDEAFATAVTEILRADVDFVLIAGDLFNTALPGIDHVDVVFRQLSRLKDAGVPVYLIAGSHDYSPTGKTMLRPLETAGLCVNVFRGAVNDGVLSLSFTQDAKTGIKLCGILGKAGQLDSALYAQLDVAALEREPGEKVFLFHAALDELTPEALRGPESAPVASLPAGFAYYAGGHVHLATAKDFPGRKNVVYPGPLFPASFSELEELGHGGFWLVERSGSSYVRTRIEVRTRRVVRIVVDADGCTPTDVEERMREGVDDVSEAIVLVRVQGRLLHGTVSDIGFRAFFAELERAGAYACLKHTAALQSPQFVESPVTPGEGMDAIEVAVIREHLGMVPVPGISRDAEERLMHELMRVLGVSQHEGEPKHVFQERIRDEVQRLLAQSGTRSSAV